MQVFDFTQYSPEWYEARCGVPTASNFHKILTPKTLQMGAGMLTYIVELIAQKYDPAYGIETDSASTAMRNGTILEPEVRRLYEFESGQRVQQVGFCKTDDGRFGCSPDGLIGEDGGLEIKSPTPATQIKYLLAGGVLPDEYRAQVHGSLIVTGRKWWDFMSHCPGTSLPWLKVRVEPDAYTEALRSALDVFWLRYKTARESIEREAAVPIVEPAELSLASDYWS